MIYLLLQYIHYLLRNGVLHFQYAFQGFIVVACKYDLMVPGPDELHPNPETLISGAKASCNYIVCTQSPYGFSIGTVRNMLCGVLGNDG